jgi:hypothetical protein
MQAVNSRWHSIWIAPFWHVWHAMSGACPIVHAPSHKSAHASMHTQLNTASLSTFDAGHSSPSTPMNDCAQEMHASPVVPVVIVPVVASVIPLVATVVPLVPVVDSPEPPVVGSAVLASVVPPVDPAVPVVVAPAEPVCVPSPSLPQPAVSATVTAIAVHVRIVCSRADDRSRRADPQVSLHRDRQRGPSPVRVPNSWNDGIFGRAGGLRTIIVGSGSASSSNVTTCADLSPTGAAATGASAAGASLSRAVVGGAESVCCRPAALWPQPTPQPTRITRS